MRLAASNPGTGPKTLLALAIALVATGCLATEPLRPHPENIVGTLSCTAASCHSGGGPRYGSGSAKGAEYIHWLGLSGTYSDNRRAYDPRARLIKTDGDPHALAAQRMQEPRFQEVLRRASGQPDGSVDDTTIERCAKCHNPGNDGRARLPPSQEHSSAVPAAQYLALSTQYSTAISQSPAPEPLPPPSLQLANHQAGIGCETCHGGARQWLTVHYQTGISRHELLNLGLIDTKNLLVRARLCASCHVGSADQDMNHDMIAAGHPPLRFEQASYEALLGRKHWDDTPARAANPNYEVQLWAAGRRAATAATLELLAARANTLTPSPNPVNPRVHAGTAVPTPWPEFAESNCLACHQPLRTNSSESIALQDFGKRGGPPAWQSWNTALVEAALFPKSSITRELPPPGTSWPAAIQQVRSAMEQTAFPDRQQIASLASQAKISLDHQTTDDFALVTASSLLENLGELDQNATWDEQCQYLAALIAARHALQDQEKLSSFTANETHKKIDRVATALRFVAPNREWPVLYSEHPTLSTTDVLRELAQIQQDLLSEARR